VCGFAREYGCVFLCKWACVYVNMCVFTWTWMCDCADMGLCLCRRECVYVDVSMFMRTWVFMWTSVCLRGHELVFI
jgi:hypothetical protein